MSDSSHQGSNILLDTVTTIFYFLGSIHWSLRISQFLTVLSFPVRIVLYPLRLVVNILLILFAPAIYVLSLFYSVFQSFFAFLSSLEPLYNFFGAAVGVGVVAGIILAFFSSYIASSLGMYDDDIPPTRRSSKHSYLQDSKRDSPSTDLDWQWLDSPSRRRRSAVGLLSQTIHEEDDDSEF